MRINSLKKIKVLREMLQFITMFLSWKENSKKCLRLSGNHLCSELRTLLWPEQTAFWNGKWGTEMSQDEGRNKESQRPRKHIRSRMHTGRQNIIWLKKAVLALHTQQLWGNQPSCIISFHLPNSPETTAILRKVSLFDSFFQRFQSCGGDIYPYLFSLFQCPGWLSDTRRF